MRGAQGTAGAKRRQAWALSLGQAHRRTALPHRLLLELRSVRRGRRSLVVQHQWRPSFQLYLHGQNSFYAERPAAVSGAAVLACVRMRGESATPAVRAHARSAAALPRVAQAAPAAGVASLIRRPRQAFKEALSAPPRRSEPGLLLPAAALVANGANPLSAHTQTGAVRRVLALRARAKLAGHGVRVEERTAAAAQVLVKSATQADKPATLNELPRTTAAGRRTHVASDTEHVAAWSKRAAPQLNIHAVAEQVIRESDNRVVAWRERMGKV